MDGSKFYMDGKNYWAILTDYVKLRPQKCQMVAYKKLKTAKSGCQCLPQVKNASVSHGAA